MFVIPPIDICRKNLQHLKEQWLSSPDVAPISPEQIYEAERFFKKCFIFHHFLIDPIWYPLIQKNKIPEILADGFLKSSHLLHKTGGGNSRQRILSLDTILGLDRYVYFSFGMPVSLPGSGAIIFALSFQTFTEMYRHPTTWVSWGDIFLVVEELFGKNTLFYERWLLDDLSNLDKKIKEYNQRIILSEEIPEAAAYFSVSNYSDYKKALLNEWKTKSRDAMFYQGPEIKIEEKFPLKNIEFCIIDKPESMAGKLVALLRQKGLINPSCIINSMDSQSFPRLYGMIPKQTQN